MRRNAKVIQINGAKGLLLAGLAIVCLAAGFIAFPGYVASCLWNRFVTFLPAINLFQGVMLWGIIALSFYIATSKKKESFIALKSTTELNEEELRQVMNAIKMQSHQNRSPLVIKSEDVRKFELREITEPSDFKNKNNLSDSTQKKEKV